jgi:hypothetical protein
MGDNFSDRFSMVPLILAIGPPTMRGRLDATDL